MPTVMFRDIDDYPTRRQCQLFEAARDARRSEVRRVMDLAERAEQLAFPRLAGLTLDLAIQVQESALVYGWRQEIDAMTAAVSDANQSWHRACIDRRRNVCDRTGRQAGVPRTVAVDPAEFDQLPN